MFSTPYSINQNIPSYPSRSQSKFQFPNQQPFKIIQWWVGNLNLFSLKFTFLNSNTYISYFIHRRWMMNIFPFYIASSTDETQNEPTAIYGEYGMEFPSFNNSQFPFLHQIYPLHSYFRANLFTENFALGYTARMWIFYSSFIGKL